MQYKILPYFLWVMVLEIRFEQKKVIQIKTHYGERGLKNGKMLKNLNFQNDRRKVIYSLKHSS